MTDAEKLYVEVMGVGALERVRAVAATRHPCCWEPVEGSHHAVCPKRPTDEPVIVAGQESLL